MRKTTEILEDLPPSAKLVYKTLEYEGEPTQQELAEATRLNSRTTRNALDRLKEVAIIEERPHFTDAHQTVYSLSQNEASV